MATAPGGNRQAPHALSPIWGPFKGPGDALNHVGQFINRVIGGNVGICWVGADGLHPLRRPIYDAHGFGEMVIIEWCNLPPPPPRPHAPSTFWAKVKSALHAYLEQQGQQALVESRMAMEQGKAINAALGTLFQRAMAHRSDTEGVLLDVLAVGLTVGFVAGPLGWAALIGGVVLLGMDGTAWGIEMAGDDEGAEWFKEKGKPIRWIAIGAAVPDAAFGLAKVFRELPEVGRTVATLRAGRAGARGAVARATAGAERTGSEVGAAGLEAAAQARRADMARRYQAIAESAQRRAAAKAKQLSDTWAKLGSVAAHEVTPRLTVPETLRLMYGELTPRDKAEVVEFMKRYVFHVVSVHR